MKRAIGLILALAVFSCYHAKPVKTLPEAQWVRPRTLFIALDGIDYALMKELKNEGYFKDFQEPVPLISTFPSATTIGFTGIFRPLGVKKIPGYEVRFFSYGKNKIIGGTPFDIYKIPIDYKYFFDSFRHTIESKAVMYSLPAVASRKDLVNAGKAVMSKDKRIVMAYLGGTDGAAHMLGRKRTKDILIGMDAFLQRLKERHLKEKGELLKVILFSDHGFQYGHLESVSNSEIKRGLQEAGLKLNHRLESDRDVVFVRFGLLSAGIVFTSSANRVTTARVLSAVEGIDLVFWHDDHERIIHILDHGGAQARFEYRNKKKYRYVPEKGDPLGYVSLLKEHGYHSGQWLADAMWKKISYDHEYPDAGYRLYDAFFDLVKNRASLMFSLKPDYQFGSSMAKAGTWLKLGQRGTHGGLFRQTSWAFAQADRDENNSPPKFFRYDEFFRYYLPQVSRAVRQDSSYQSEEYVETSPSFTEMFSASLDEGGMSDQLLALEKWVLEE